MNLSNYKITYNVILRTALAKIDANKQGFVVIVDAGNTVKGVLTDGDVRRAIIRGHTAEEKIEGIYTKNPKTVFMTEGFEAVIDFFKSQAIKFLPIVDEERKLVNLITKNQLHTLLLQDVHADLTYDFSKLDDRAFEKMCRDLLVDMGFQNVTQRGNTRASDGGVDLEADMKVETILGEQKQHWIFQCKHTKAQIDRKDISEIPDLLEEFQASGYGLFYSGMLSPQTLDRIKKKESIIYWAKGELEILLRKYKNTAIRYFGI